MPPRKRKATSKSTTPAKKLRIWSTTDISAPPAASSSGRPKRTTVGVPTYDFKRHRSSRTQNATPPAVDPEPQPNKRGRTQNANHPTVDPEPQPKKKPGRPPKKVTPSVNGSGKSQKAPTPVLAVQEDAEEEEEEAPPKKRGRLAKSTSAPSSEALKKRGRKPKASVEVVSSPENDSDDPLALDTTENTTLKITGSKTEDRATLDPDVQYWLMKAEPNSRIERGHDVKFSIDDLAARTEPEAWDGVRNFVARNNLRAMRKGDLAFFYHSNCKEPGVVGVMRIVAEHSPDENAFNPEHPYFDPKSDRTNPKWDVVHVEFVKKFDDLVGLKELKSFSKPGGALDDMQTLKQTRLSISSVSPDEWKFILELAGESIALGHGNGIGGYESGVDGEGEETAGLSDADGLDGLLDDNTDRSGQKGNGSKSQVNGIVIDSAYDAGDDAA